MASEKLANIEPWEFRSPFAADLWFSDAFTRETETFTKSLQQSILINNTDSKFNSEVDFDYSISPFIDAVNHKTAESTPAVSNVPGSDHETAKKHGIPVGSNGKVSKRKSRVSKRKLQTTFITVDPANFRHMVQQVTGVRFGKSSQVSMEAILMSEPQRLANNRFASGLGWLPTLDTSAFLLDHHQQQQNVIMGPTATSATDGTPQIVEGDPLGFQSTAGGVELDFDCLSSSFPTLESWKVM